MRKDIDLIRSVQHEEFSRVLTSPVINGEKKVNIFSGVFSGKISPLTLNFFNLIFKKGRSEALKDILESFDDHYRAWKGIDVIELTTAEAMNDTVRDQMRQRFQELPRYKGRIVELREKVVKLDFGTPPAGTGEPSPLPAPGITDDVASALINLGYKEAVVKKALAEVSPTSDDTVETLLKQVLKLLMK